MGPPEAYLENTTDFCVSYNGGEDSMSGHANSENNWACMLNKLFLGNTPVPAMSPYTPDAFYKVDGEGSPDLGTAVSLTEYTY